MLRNGYVTVHYIQQRRTNVYNCSSTTVDKRQPNEWPSHIHRLTDWLIVTDSYIPYLCPATDNFTGLSLLDLSNNKISEVCEEFLEEISKLRNMTELNLSQNKFTTIPKGLANLTHLKKIYLGANPFHCDCSMTWTIEWLNKFTDLMGDHIIADYKNVKCHDGQVAGRPIYTLNPVDMNCFPSMWTMWQKIAVGVGSAVAIVIITLLIVVKMKGSREVKFLMYYYLRLDTVPKDDKNENVDNMEYDAFLCYRYKVIILCWPILENANL